MKEKIPKGRARARARQDLGSFSWNISSVSSENKSVPFDSLSLYATGRIAESGELGSDH